MPPKGQLAPEPVMRHPKFQWDGFNMDGATVSLALHAQYAANNTIHRLIVENIQRIMGSQFDVALFGKRWELEEIRATAAQFVKRMLRRAVPAADKLDDQGDLSLWIEIEPPPIATHGENGAGEFEKAGRQ